MRRIPRRGGDRSGRLLRTLRERTEPLVLGSGLGKLSPVLVKDEELLIFDVLCRSQGTADIWTGAPKH